MSCSSSSLPSRNIYGYCKKSLNIDYEAKKEQKLTRKTLTPNDLSSGVYQYDGFETVLRAEVDGKVFIIKAEETWVSNKKKPDIKTLKPRILCVRNAQMYKDTTGLQFRFSEVSDMNSQNATLKTSALREFTILFNPQKKEPSEVLTFSSTELPSLPNSTSPKDHYQKVNKRYAFFKSNASDEEYQLRTQFQVDEFTITNIIKYKRKK